MLYMTHTLPLTPAGIHGHISSRSGKIRPLGSPGGVNLSSSYRQCVLSSSRPAVDDRWFEGKNKHDLVGGLFQPL